MEQTFQLRIRHCEEEKSPGTQHPRYLRHESLGGVTLVQLTETRNRINTPEALSQRKRDRMCNCQSGVPHG
jgi:hypothetical protein